MSPHPPRLLTATLLAAAALAASAGPAAAADFAWKGVSTHPQVSLASNWVGGVAPTTGESIGTLAVAPEHPSLCPETGPASFGCNRVDNDVDGLSVHHLDITDARTDLDGNPFTLGAGGLHAQYTTEGSQGVISAPIMLGADQTWTVDRPADKQDYGNFGFLQVGDMSGDHALAVNYDAFSFLAFTGFAEIGPATFTSPPSTILYGPNGRDGYREPHVQVLGSLNAVNGNPVVVNHAELEVYGDVGAVDLHDAELDVSPGSDLRPRAAGLTMASDSRIGIWVTAETARGAASSSLAVTGPVHLAGYVKPTSLGGVCFEPELGTSFTVLSTTGPLTGSFTGDLSASRESIYSGYQCADMSDRAIEYRYDRTSMPRTVKMVVVPRSAPDYPNAPDATPTPVASATSAPVVTATPAPRPVASTPTATLVPKSGVFLSAGGTLKLTIVALKPTKKGTCPKHATVTVTSGNRKTEKSVKVKRSGDACVIDSALTLHGKLAKASSVKVKIHGKGIKTKKKTVKAA